MQLVKFCDIIEIAQLGREKFSFGNFGFAPPPPPNNNVLATALATLYRIECVDLVFVRIPVI